jgi:hypothetical protein
MPPVSVTMHALKLLVVAVVVVGFDPHAETTKPSVIAPATTAVHRTRRKAFSLLL